MRAFVGQVEPTYDWSIRQPDTRQAQSAELARLKQQEQMLKEQKAIAGYTTPTARAL